MGWNVRWVLGAVAVGFLLGAVVGGPLFGSPAVESRPADTESDALPSTHLFWVAGDVVAAENDRVTLALDGERVTFGTGHGVLFVHENGTWTSRSWQTLDPGTTACVAAHLHDDGTLHVVKAFAGATCGARPA